VERRRRQARADGGAARVRVQAPDDEALARRRASRLRAGWCRDRTTPRLRQDDEPYFDRLDRQLNHLLASVDAAATAMGTLLDLQLNERPYVVGAVATIFVPLTFITGFFGVNFGWMGDQIGTQIAFWLLGSSSP
jgi:Mg2+ and Co2+ transporter CorA